MKTFLFSTRHDPMIKICLIEAVSVEEALAWLGMEPLHPIAGPDFVAARFAEPSKASAFCERLRQLNPALAFTRWGGEFRLEALHLLTSLPRRKDRT